MTDAIEVLRSDHDEVRALLSELEAPTRLHPNLAPAPEALRLAGRIAGATDRIRDALVGRTGR
jgi:hypothetical protein